MQKKNTIVIGVPSSNLGYTLQKNPIWRWFYYDLTFPIISHVFGVSALRSATLSSFFNTPLTLGWGWGWGGGHVNVHLKLHTHVMLPWVWGGVGYGVCEYSMEFALHTRLHVVVERFFLKQLRVLGRCSIWSCQTGHAQARDSAGLPWRFHARLHWLGCGLLYIYIYIDL